jgi:hypothetical protein
VAESAKVRQGPGITAISNETTSEGESPSTGAERDEYLTLVKDSEKEQALIPLRK